MAKKRLIERLQPLLKGINFYVDEDTVSRPDGSIEVRWALYVSRDSVPMAMNQFPIDGSSVAMTGLNEDAAFQHFKQLIESGEV